MPDFHHHTPAEGLGRLVGGSLNDYEAGVESVSGELQVIVNNLIEQKSLKASIVWF